MKLKYIVCFGVVCALSLVSVFFFQGTNSQDLNRNFGIETIAGDPSILDEIAFSAVINEGANQFSRVTLSSGEPQFEPTIYDLHHGLDDRQLEHRELYRDAVWARIFEFENYTFNAQFNSEYIWNSRYKPNARIAVLDANTGEVNVLNHEFLEITPGMPVYGWDTFILEQDEEFYYVLPTENNEILVYQLSVESMTLEFMFKEEFSIGGNQDNWVHWFTIGDNKLYGQVYGDEIETYVFNFDTRNFEEVDFDVDFITEETVVRGTQMVFQEYVEDGSWFQFRIFDTETETLTELETPSFSEEIVDDWPWSNTTLLENYLVINIRIPQAQYFVIYDLDTLELIYEGRINLRRDQGLVEKWGEIEGFQPILKD